MGRLIVVLCSLLLITACGSQEAEVKEQALTRAAVKQVIIDRGLDPEYIDIEQMIENGDASAFPIKSGGGISGQQIAALARDWPEQFKPEYVDQMQNYGRLRAQGVHFSMTLRESMACGDLRGDAFRSDFCHCVRFPNECYAETDSEAK